MGMSAASGAKSGGRRGRRGRKHGAIAEINMTPFIDVMLVLLIIFMVTAPLLKAGVPIQLPESRAKALAEEKAGLEGEVEQLRSFETDYRSRLTSYIEGQLREIRAQKRVEPPAPTA